MSKILFISGSPRQGNCEFLIKKIHDSITSDKEIILLRNKNIKNCIGCLSCHNEFNCVTKDDMRNIYKSLVSADMIIIATPNYFDNVSGLLKNFIDRIHPFYKFPKLKDKKIILLIVGGGKIEGSLEYLKKNTEGLIKYLKLNLIGSFGFEALNNNDLKSDKNFDNEIKNIIDTINSNLK